MDETEIVKGCAKGSENARRHLYERFSDQLYRIALRYVRDQNEAEDITLISFTKIFDRISKFENRHEGSLVAWMRKIVVNEALMVLRKRHNFNLVETIDHNLDVPDLSALQDVEADYIYALLLDLPLGYRTVFNLYVIEGYDHQEIGEMLGVSANTSRTQLFKAKSVLKKKIEKGNSLYGT